MPQSLAQIYVHIIFSTKDRNPFLLPDIRAELFPYTATVLRNLECYPVEVGGVEDHLHILCSLSKNLAVKELMEKVKTPTSKWLKTKSRTLQKFHWQSGYGAFSVSASQLETVSTYIRNQEQHHQKIGFQDEFRKFLKRYKIEYDERYVWD
jgi:REP element-mobilizing transposase RayT